MNRRSLLAVCASTAFLSGCLTDDDDETGFDEPTAAVEAFYEVEERAEIDELLHPESMMNPKSPGHGIDMEVAGEPTEQERNLTTDDIDARDVSIEDGETETIADAENVIMEIPIELVGVGDERIETFEAWFVAQHDDRWYLVDRTVAAT